MRGNDSGEKQAACYPLQFVVFNLMYKNPCIFNYMVMRYLFYPRLLPGSHFGTSFNNSLPASGVNFNQL